MKTRPDLGEIHYYAKRDASPGGTNLRNVCDFGWRVGFQDAVAIVRESKSVDEALSKLRRIAPLQGDQAHCVVCERPREGDVCPCGARWP